MRKKCTKLTHRRKIVLTNFHLPRLQKRSTDFFSYFFSVLKETVDG